jgi:serine/threonine protein kinase
MEIDVLLKEAESLTLNWMPENTPVSKTREWPENTPENAGYKITQDICQVTNGSIKLCESEITGSFQVVKCFEKAKMQKDTLEQMKEEVELMFALGAHRNIGEALQVFQDSLSYYVVQPYYAGGNLVNLKARAVSAGVVPIEEWWANIARQCLKGLAHMHALDVTHCDIKEQNIMVRGEDLWEPEVVIIDLGVAQRGSTQRSIIYGTPGYIPPEVWEAKNWYPQSDMFSLGVVVLQMLIGRMGIFTDDTTTFKDVEEATRCRTPPFELMPVEYPSLKWLAQKLLSKEFQIRPSAKSLLQEPWEDVPKGSPNNAQLRNRRSSLPVVGTENGPLMRSMCAGSIQAGLHRPAAAVSSEKRGQSQSRGRSGAPSVAAGSLVTPRASGSGPSALATPRDVRPVAAGFAQKLYSHRRVKSF